MKYVIIVYLCPVVRDHGCKILLTFRLTDMYFVVTCMYSVCMEFIFNSFTRNTFTSLTFCVIWGWLLPISHSFWCAITGERMTSQGCCQSSLFFPFKVFRRVLNFILFFLHWQENVQNH